MQGTCTGLNVKSWKRGYVPNRITDVSLHLVPVADPAGGQGAMPLIKKMAAKGGQIN